MAHLKTLCNLKTKSSIPVLHMVGYSDGVLRKTDLDMDILVKADDIAPRLKDGNLYISDALADGKYIIADRLIADFPNPIDLKHPIGELTLNSDYIPVLEWVAKAASHDETRYYLNGLYIDPENVIIATDGHRLHSFKTPAIKWLGAKKGIIMPIKFVKTMLDMLKETKTDYFTIYIDEHGISTMIGSAKIVSKEIDGTYPAWRKVTEFKFKTVTIPFYQWQLAGLYECAKTVKKYVMPKIGRNDQYIKFVDDKATINNSFIDEIARNENNKMLFEPMVGFGDKFKGDVAFNIKYLKEMPNGNMTYQKKLPKSSFFLFEGVENGIEKLAVVMPVRI